MSVSLDSALDNVKYFDRKICRANEHQKERTKNDDQISEEKSDIMGLFVQIGALDLLKKIFYPKAVKKDNDKLRRKVKRLVYTTVCSKTPKWTGHIYAKPFIKSYMHRNQFAHPILEEKIAEHLSKLSGIDRKGIVKEAIKEYSKLHLKQYYAKDKSYWTESNSDFSPKDLRYFLKIKLKHDFRNVLKEIKISSNDFCAILLQENRDLLFKSALKVFCAFREHNKRKINFKSLRKIVKCLIFYYFKYLLHKDESNRLVKKLSKCLCESDLEYVKQKGKLSREVNVSDKKLPKEVYRNIYGKLDEQINALFKKDMDNFIQDHIDSCIDLRNEFTHLRNIIPTIIPQVKQHVNGAFCINKQDKEYLLGKLMLLEQCTLEEYKSRSKEPSKFITEFNNLKNAFEEVINCNIKVLGKDIDKSLYKYKKHMEYLDLVVSSEYVCKSINSLKLELKKVNDFASNLINKLEPINLIKCYQAKTVFSNEESDMCCYLDPLQYRIEKYIRAKYNVKQMFANLQDTKMYDTRNNCVIYNTLKSYIKYGIRDFFLYRQSDEDGNINARKKNLGVSKYISISIEAFYEIFKNHPNIKSKYLNEISDNTRSLLVYEVDLYFAKSLSIFRYEFPKTNLNNFELYELTESAFKEEKSARNEFIRKKRIYQEKSEKEKFKNNLEEVFFDWLQKFKKCLEVDCYEGSGVVNMKAKNRTFTIIIKDSKITVNTRKSVGKNEWVYEDFSLHGLNYSNIQLVKTIAPKTQNSPGSLPCDSKKIKIYSIGDYHDACKIGSCFKRSVSIKNEELMFTDYVGFLHWLMDCPGFIIPEQRIAMEKSINNLKQEKNLKNKESYLTLHTEEWNIRFFREAFNGTYNEYPNYLNGGDCEARPTYCGNKLTPGLYDEYRRFLDWYTDCPEEYAATCSNDVQLMDLARENYCIKQCEEVRKFIVCKKFVENKKEFKVEYFKSNRIEQLYIKYLIYSAFSNNAYVASMQIDSSLASHFVQLRNKYESKDILKKDLMKKFNELTCLFRRHKVVYTVLKNANKHYCYCVKQMNDCFRSILCNADKEYEIFKDVENNFDKSSNFINIFNEIKTLDKNLQKIMLYNSQEAFLLLMQIYRKKSHINKFLQQNNGLKYLDFVLWLRAHNENYPKNQCEFKTRYYKYMEICENDNLLYIETVKKLCNDCLKYFDDYYENLKNDKEFWKSVYDKHGIHLYRKDDTINFNVIQL